MLTELLKAGDSLRWSALRTARQGKPERPLDAKEEYGSHLLLPKLLEQMCGEGRGRTTKSEKRCALWSRFAGKDPDFR